jgi:hypothetical protein
MHFSTKYLQITLRCIHLISGKAAPSHHCYQISDVNNPADEADSCKAVISLRIPWEEPNFQVNYHLRLHHGVGPRFPVDQEVVALVLGPVGILASLIQRLV